MQDRHEPSSCPRRQLAPLSRVVLASIVAMAAFACGGPSREDAQPPSSAVPASGQLTPSDQPADTSPEPSPLCRRLEQERAALDLGEPLRARVGSFSERASAWLAQASPPRAAAAALGALLADPHDVTALAALQRESPRAFASAPDLRVDATLVALTALDGAPPLDSNEAVRELLARAREWHPREPAIPWIEALLVPELGGRRARLEEAFAWGAREPALVLALARARLRDADWDGTLAALATLPAPTTPPGEPLGAALREQALVLQQALASREAHELNGVRVWARTSVPDTVAGELARTIRADLDEAAALLGGAPRASLVVWVYDDAGAMAEATCGASWSTAIYDGALHVVLAAPALDDALRTSVRHEAFHAQLDALTPLAPRWLHEGGAQRFAEEPLDREGLGSAVTPSVRTLQELDARLGPRRSGSDAGAAYALARAAVDELCARLGDVALAQAVAALRAGLPASELPARLGFAAP